MKYGNFCNDKMHKYTENSREWAYEYTGCQKTLHIGNSFET